MIETILLYPSELVCILIIAVSILEIKGVLR